MDNRRIGVGGSMYYPVSVEGALLSMGDAHSAQGDSEFDGKSLTQKVYTQPNHRHGSMHMLCMDICMDIHLHTHQQFQHHRRVFKAAAVPSHVFLLDSVFHVVLYLGLLCFSDQAAPACLPQAVRT